MPQTRKMTIGLIDTDFPRVIISDIAFNKMKLYVDLVSSEIGWLGSVEYDKETGNFYIDDVFLLEQEVNGANTTITSDGQANFIMNLIKTGQKDLLNSIKFWGHSHVNMGVDPSGQDKETLEMLKPDVDPDYFLRGIFNKSGDAKFTLYWHERGLIIDNLEWEVDDALDEEFIQGIKDEIKKKVKSHYQPPIRKTVRNYPYSGFQNFRNQYPHLVDDPYSMEDFEDVEIEEIEDPDDMDDLDDLDMETLLMKLLII